MENLKKELKKISGGKVLDVGTGRGEFIRILKEGLSEYNEIIGIDFEQGSIDFCENQFKEDDNIHFIKMDATNMNFDDNTFDTVCISNSLHHLEDLDPILKEMKRVLKPNGYFMISEMYQDNQTHAQMSHVLIHHWSSKIDTALGTYHGKTYKRQAILDVVNDLQLQDIIVFDYKYETDNPKNEETINYFNDLIEKVFNRIRQQNLDHSLIDEGINIKEWIQKHGFESATELMVIGKK